MADKSFTARPAGQKNINVSSSSQRVALGTSGACDQCRIHNDGTATVHIEFGDSTIAAGIGTSISVGAGTTEVLGCRGATHVAAIAAGSTGYIRFNPGTGI